jgi:hypothetical protein
MSDSIKSRSEMRTLVTDSFRSNHEAIFGERKPGRGRWVQDPKTGQLVPADEYVAEDINERQPLYTDRYLEGTCSPEGVDIGSKRKRDEYMKREGLAHASDYREHNRKMREKRNEFFRGNTGQHPEITETVGRLAYRLQTQRGKKR